MRKFKITAFFCAVLAAAAILTGCASGGNKAETPALAEEYSQRLEQLLTSEVEKVTCSAQGETYTMTDSDAIAQLMELLGTVEFVDVPATHAPGSAWMTLSFRLSDGRGVSMTLPECNLEYEDEKTGSAYYCLTQTAGADFDEGQILSLFQEKGESK